jgi:OPA family glycerol-3-phosphate transporter-like MFS transporter 1/2
MASALYLVRLLARYIPTQLTIRREDWLKLFVFLLTYLSYLAYHASRKPISVVKTSEAFLNCGVHKNSTRNSSTDTPCSSWINEVNGTTSSDANILLATLDTSYLFAYAIGIFFSGFIAERVDLRIFLTVGQVMAGGLAILYGLAYSLEIRAISFFIAVQVAQGLFQSTGWPGLVPVMGNWFGKSKRGLIMGLWNTHTSVGNIVGTLIAGAFVTTNWGLSFIVPGILIAAVGLLFFFFLVPHPEELRLTEKEEKEVGEERVKEEVQEDQAVSLLGALRIPGVVEFSLCLFFAKLVR